MTLLGFAWGLAEATFFFLVPDVALTFVAIRNLRRAVLASLAALAGALLGGAIMYFWAPENLLDYVPGISPALIDSVRRQIDTQGLMAVLIAPLRGTPYKIYAVEWSLRGGGFVPFLLISIPARYTRFILSVLIVRALGNWVLPHRWHYASLVTFWLLFYAWYFHRFAL